MAGMAITIAIQAIMVVIITAITRVAIAMVIAIRQHIQQRLIAVLIMVGIVIPRHITAMADIIRVRAQALASTLDPAAIMAVEVGITLDPIIHVRGFAVSVTIIATRAIAAIRLR